jgi:hypothetical protein
MAEAPQSGGQRLCEIVLGGLGVTFVYIVSLRLGRMARWCGSSMGRWTLLVAAAVVAAPLLLLWWHLRAGAAAAAGLAVPVAVTEAHWAVRGDLPLLHPPSTPFCVPPALAGVAVDAAEVDVAVRAVSRWWQFEAGRALAALYDAEPNKPAVDYRYEPALAASHRRFDMLGPVGPRCRADHLVSYGSGDDEKRACGLQLLAKAAGPGCHVVSIGSNNQWGFEEAIVAQTDCRVSTFDCTLPLQLPPALQGRVRAYPACLGDRDEVDAATGRTYVSWPSLLRMAGLTHAPTHVKMDIEGYEYAALRSMWRSGVLLPLQISLELHYHLLTVPAQTTHTAMQRLLSAGELALFAREWLDVGQYLLIDRNDNPLCPVCTEIVLMRFACDDAATTAASTPKDAA